MGDKDLWDSAANKFAEWLWCSPEFVKSCFKKAPSDGFVYVMRDWNKYKIWRTKKIDTRFKTLSCWNTNISVVYSKYFSDYFAEEKRLHKKFADKKIKWEWYSLSKDDLKSL